MEFGSLRFLLHRDSPDVPSEVFYNLNFNSMNRRTSDVRRILFETLGFANSRENPADFLMEKPKVVNKQTNFDLSVCLNITTDYPLKTSRLSEVMEKIKSFVTGVVREALLDGHKKVSIKISFTITHSEVFKAKEKCRVKTKLITLKPITIAHVE